MSTKVLFKTLVPFGMLVVIFLAAQIVSSKSASAPASGDAVKVLVVAGPDMIKQRSDNLRAINYARSDYIERHPSNFFVGSDYFERHPGVVIAENDLAGSDWIERHPAAATRTNFFAGSDWIERHPSAATRINYFAGSDYFERHPSNYYAGSDWIERQP
jgi:hypothetical protein